MNVESGCALHVDHCGRSELSSCPWASSLGNLGFMAKKYVAYPVGRRDRAGNVMRGFIIGLAEFGSFGTRLYDLAGYPHDSEEDALRASWQAIGADMWKAVEEVQQQPDDERGQSTSPKDDSTAKK